MNLLSQKSHGTKLEIRQWHLMLPRQRVWGCWNVGLCQIFPRTASGECTFLWYHNHTSHHITSHRAQHPHHDLLKKIQGNYQISTGLLGDPRVPCATWKTNAHGLALGDSKYICWGLVSLRLCNGAMEQYQTSWVQKRAGRMLGISVNIAPRHGSLV